jgi:hypothetical protein
MDDGRQHSNCMKCGVIVNFSGSLCTICDEELKAAAEKVAGLRGQLSKEELDAHTEPKRVSKKAKLRLRVAELEMMIADVRDVLNIVELNPMQPRKWQVARVMRCIKIIDEEK